ncbi:MAG TPA: preprotein translocase subunit YajC [Pirellulales bacterium]|jgi:preprotein translocase subunit YajC|nr:preprotein translocase subunit YajC [Pirellulales bacterium]
MDLTLLADFCCLFAQAENGGVPAGGDGAAGAPAGGGGSALGTLFPLLMIGLLFYFILLRPERRKHKEHANLLSNLKKNDKVVTIGGIYGKVFDVQREQDRVTLKIDESTNTKIDVTFAAIARVIIDQPAESEK